MQGTATAMVLRSLLEVDLRRARSRKTEPYLYDTVQSVAGGVVLWVPSGGGKAFCISASGFVSRKAQIQFLDEADWTLALDL